MTKPDMTKIRTISIHSQNGLEAMFKRWPGGWMKVVERVVIEPLNDDFEDGGLVQQHNNLYCSACGMMAAPGDEEFDWCDHITGEGCAYMDDVEDDDFDYGFDD